MVGLHFRFEVEMIPAPPAKGSIPGNICCFCVKPFLLFGHIYNKCICIDHGLDFNVIVLTAKV